MEKMPIIFIDHSALKDIFEGKKSGDKLLKKMNDMNYEGKLIHMQTSMSCFLRAIFLCDPEIKISTIQKTLNILKIGPSFADFKNEEQVINEVMKIAHIASGGKI